MVILLPVILEIVPVEATLDGILRGLIRDGYPVNVGFKMADIIAEKAAKVCYYRECGFTEEQIIEQIIDEEYNKFYHKD